MLPHGWSYRPGLMAGNSCGDSRTESGPSLSGGSLLEKQSRFSFAEVARSSSYRLS
jgi:hypothetical protein